MRRRLLLIKYTPILPSGYTELAYLESTGTQYIDTGLKPQSNEVAEITFQYTSAQSTIVFGCRTSNSSGKYTIGSGSSNTIIYGALGSHANVTLASFDTSKHTVILDTGSNKAKIDNGSEVSVGTFSSNNLNIFIFACNANGIVNYQSSAKIFGIKIGSRMNLVPAKRDSDDVVGMYDLIGNTFLTNAGTETFIRGYKLPDSYTNLTYLESSGTQYIDTGYALNTDTDDVELDFGVSTTSSNIIFGARRTTSARLYTISTASNKWRLGWGSGSTDSTSASTGRHIAKVNHSNGELQIDGTVVVTAGAASITTPATATLFAIHTNASTPFYYGSCKVYEYRLWRSGVLIQHLVPAMRDSDSVVGMYDIVNNAFLTNGGSGDFSYGTL